MSQEIPGIHHVTAITGDAQANVDFYTGVLGLRLVKLTVNFDDPASYHLYYGDERGTPGTIMTFFAWRDAPQGRGGTGQVTETSFAVPPGSLGFWESRLRERGIAFEGPLKRFEDEALLFVDPDGISLALVAARTGDGFPWRGGAVPEEHAVRGFHGVTMSEEGYERTAHLLTSTFGFRLTRDAGNRFRYEAGGGGIGAVVDLLCMPDGQRGRIAAGTVHHVAWRTPDDPSQAAWRAEIARLSYNVTPVLDRQYFHSIYFREPGGVLFEIATDPPGFAIDEPVEALGTHLKLPPWLERARAEIERLVPPLRLPSGTTVGIAGGAAGGGSV